MKKKIALLSMLLVMALIASIAFAANISYSETKNDAAYSEYAYGSVSKLHYQGTRYSDNNLTNYNFTSIYNTFASPSQTTLRVTVRTERYNEYAHAVDAHADNSSNSLAPGTGIGTAGVIRIMNTTVYSEYHKGTAVANNAAGTSDTYSIHIF